MIYINACLFVCVYVCIYICLCLFKWKFVCNIWEWLCASHSVVTSHSFDMRLAKVLFMVFLPHSFWFEHLPFTSWLYMLQGFISVANTHRRTLAPNLLRLTMWCMTWEQQKKINESEICGLISFFPSSSSFFSWFELMYYIPAYNTTYTMKYVYV